MPTPRSSIPPRLPIVDAHHHFWAYGAHRYPWLDSDSPSIVPDRKPLRRAYLAADYREDAAGMRLTGSVHLDGGFDPDDPVGETRMVQAIAEREDLPSAIVAGAPLHRPDAERLIEAHLAASPRVRGVRHITAWHRDSDLTYVDRPDLMRDRDWRRGLALVAERHLSFDLQIYPSQMDDAADLADTHPSVDFVVDQAGMPLFRRPGDREAWEAGLERLAARPNVSIKLSGFGMCGVPVEVGSVGPLVRDAVALFGPDRAMFASNFPVDRLYSSLTGLFAVYAASIPDLSESDRGKLFAGTAARIYRLDHDPATKGLPT